MIDKELIRQAAEDIDIFEADLTEEYERLCKPGRRTLRLWPLAAAACVAGIAVIFLKPPSISPQEGEKQGSTETITTQEVSPLRGDLEGSLGGSSSLDAQLAHQQEIKEKGERLAAFVQQHTTIDIPL